jgi:hypothetical protein
MENYYGNSLIAKFSKTPETQKIVTIEKIKLQKVESEWQNE